MDHPCVGFPEEGGMTMGPTYTTGTQSEVVGAACAEVSFDPQRWLDIAS